MAFISITSFHRLRCQRIMAAKIIYRMKGILPWAEVKKLRQIVIKLADIWKSKMAAKIWYRRFQNDLEVWILRQFAKPLESLRMRWLIRRPIQWTGNSILPHFDVNSYIYINLHLEAACRFPEIWWWLENFSPGGLRAPPWWQLQSYLSGCHIHFSVSKYERKSAQITFNCEIFVENKKSALKCITNFTKQSGITNFFRQNTPKFCHPLSVMKLQTDPTI